MCNLVLTILNEHLSYFLSPLPSQMSQSFNKNPRLASFPKAAPKNNVSKRCTKTILRMNTPMSPRYLSPHYLPTFLAASSAHKARLHFNSALCKQNRGFIWSCRLKKTDDCRMHTEYAICTALHSLLSSRVNMLPIGRVYLICFT